MKVSDGEIRLAEWILKKWCCTQNPAGCRTCPHASICTAWGSEDIPEEWDIPEPLPEPLERPRIEWLRMLPDSELIKVVFGNKGISCSYCEDDDDENCYLPCYKGVLLWWHKEVTLEKFRKELYLDEPDRTMERP